MRYKCLACGVEVYDIPNSSETIIHKLIHSGIISNLDILWEHEEICPICKVYILRITADNLEAGNFVLDKEETPFTMQ
jgi:hypothetical protein